MAYVNLGSTPCGEECCQVGDPEYNWKAHKECAAYINQLYRIIEAKGLVIPPGFTLKVQGNQHDFGTYHEVVCRFDDNEASWDLASYLDNNTPEFWDDVAKQELNLT